MNPPPELPVLCIMIIGVLLAAGCLGQTSGNQATVTTITVTSAPMVTTMTVAPVPAPCPPPANRSYWIRINPIVNVTYGNPVFISGLTNLPEGETLHVRISPYMPPHSRYAPPVIDREVIIRRSENCTNNFTYFTDVTNLNEDYNGSRIDVEVYSLDFNLTGYNFPAHLSEFYLINQGTS